jgi:hypothetical protein
MDKVKFIEIFNSMPYDFRATVEDLHAVLDPMLGLSDHPRLSYDEACQLYYAWRMCSETWEVGYDDGYESGHLGGFNKGYGSGYEDGQAASDRVHTGME